jgi:O-antigen/teichoic acid export membrane protein
MDFNVGLKKFIDSHRQLFCAPELGRALSLRLNFTWTFAGNLVYSGSRWVMLAMLAKLGSPEMVGQFSLGLAVSAPVFMLTNLQLRTIQATDAREEYVFGDYLALRLVMTALAILVIAGIAISSSYRPETAWVVFLVGLSKVFESVSDIFYGLFQRHERMDRVALSMMLRGPSALVLVGVGVLLTTDLIWATVGLVIAFALTLVGYDFPVGRRTLGSVQQTEDRQLLNASQTVSLHPRWEASTLTRLVWLSLPLGCVMMLISLRTNIPRYFVEHYLGERELGIFAAMIYLMVVGNQLVVALGRSATPRLANHYAHGNVGAFRVLLFKLIGIGALVGVMGVLGAALWGRGILQVLYRPEYAEHPSVFLWLMIAAAFSHMASFLGYAMTAARQFWAQIPLFVAVNALTVVTCFWLVPSLGLKGGAISYAISMATELLCSLVVVGLALRALSHKE